MRVLGSNSALEVPTVPRLYEFTLIVFCDLQQPHLRGESGFRQAVSCRYAVTTYFRRLTSGSRYPLVSTWKACLRRNCGPRRGYSCEAFRIGSAPSCSCPEPLLSRLPPRGESLAELWLELARFGSSIGSSDTLPASLPAW